MKLKENKYKYEKRFFQILLIYIILFFFNNYKKNNKKIIIKENELDYENINFVIIKRSCSNCGLFSNYIVYLGCVNEFISKGYVPIIDVKSFKNFFNNYSVNLSDVNPWEIFFDQPFGYTLNNVLIKAKKIKYIICNSNINRPGSKIFFNQILIDFWHNIAKLYIPIKFDIINESNIIIRKLFNGSNNVLGFLIRGTDYISRRPRNHPIPPTPKMAIKDIKAINEKNNYDWFFISTEDDIIREIFIKEFGSKVKFLISYSSYYISFPNEKYHFLIPFYRLLYFTIHFQLIPLLTMVFCIIPISNNIIYFNPFLIYPI